MQAQSSRDAHTGTSRTAIETLAWLIQDAFEGDPSHSLLSNLRDLRDEDWTSLPPGGGRSIADIVEHVGWAKWMYAGEINHIRALLRGTDRWPYE